MILLSIDDIEVEVEPGTTVLAAVRQLGGELPTLCDDDRLAPFGACRLCLVGVAGTGGPVAACTTPCREGMRIDTHDPVAARVARIVVELLLSELPEPPEPDTELARIARRLGVLGTRFQGPTHAVAHDEHHPYLAFRHELCISCGRCVRACDELQGAFALTATGRGFGSNVAAGLDAGFRDSSCVSCGACADTCPTGAIIELGALESNGGRPR